MVVEPHGAGPRARRRARAPRRESRVQTLAPSANGESFARRTASSLVVDRDNGDDRPEELLAAEPRRDRLADEHRRRVEPPGKPGRRAVAAGHDSRAVLDRVGDEVLDTRALLLADERAELDRRIVPVADPQRARAVDEPLDERVVQRAVDVDALDTRADLAAVRERPPERALDGAVEIGVVEHEHRILPAELERDRAQALARPTRDDAGPSRSSR